MLQIIMKSIMLLTLAVIICCGVYPAAVWVVGNTFFSAKANGSLITGLNNKIIGSKLIAQPFTKDEYFQPRPSAASYNAAASASSSLAPSNYILRDRVARALGPVVRYASGVNAGKLVGPDVEEWFKQDMFQGKKDIVAQWTQLHPAIAQGQRVFNSAEIQSLFFDMWRQDHPDVELQDVPGDFVTASASGLDPDISLANAEFQLDRVASKWAFNLKRDPNSVKQEIEQILQAYASAPLNGLLGEKFVNVLEVNLELQKRYMKM